MDRINAKGHKPWIRPYMSHCWNLKRGKAMVIKKVSPTARQLALLRLGTFSVVNDSAKLVKLVDALTSCETSIQEPICADMGCGEVGDYSLTYADPSRPPPKHGWLQKAMQYAAAFFLFLMVLIGFTACKKEPIPDVATPKQTSAMAPNDTIPRVPMDPGEPATMLTADQRATITWNWYNWIGYFDFINPDTIEYYANRHNIDRITLMPDTNSIESNEITCLMYTPYDFHRIRDTIGKYWDILEQHGKIVNGGDAIIYVNKYNGAQLPNNYELNGYVPYGMSLEDSVWYTSKGYRVMRGYGFYYKSGDTNIQHKYKSQMDSVRPALYTKQMQQFDTAKYNRLRQNRYQGR